MASSQRIMIWTGIVILLFMAAATVFADGTMSISVSPSPEVSPSPAPSGSPGSTPAPSGKPVTVKAQDTRLASAISKAFKTPVTEEDIAGLRVNSRLGYGEIGLLYGLANASGKSTEDILAMRQTMGWGQLAQSLGLKVSTVMSRNSSVLKAAKMEKEDKALQQKMADEQKNKSNMSSGKGNNTKNNESGGKKNGSSGNSNGNNGSNGGNGGHNK